MKPENYTYYLKQLENVFDDFYRNAAEFSSGYTFDIAVLAQKKFGYIFPDLILGDWVNICEEYKRIVSADNTEALSVHLSDVNMDSIAPEPAAPEPVPENHAAPSKAPGNRIIYDWVTFTSKIDDPQSIIDMLGLGGVAFTELDHGFNGYPRCLFFGGISICYGGREDMGVCCNMSGKGCRAFETFGNGNYKAIFDNIIDHYSEDSEKRLMNLTRLDVAYDDFEGLLDMQTIHSATIAGGYKKCEEKDMDGKTCTYYKLFQGDFVSRFNHYELTVSSKGMTCGYGSMSSDIYIRIYDKLSEQRASDLDHWVRCEIQLRRGNAMGFILLTGNISDNYFGVLNNYLRFIEPSDSDSNKRRAKTAPWWDRFLESRDKLSIYQKPGITYDVTSLDGYVYKQCAGAVYTMIELVGQEEFMRRLEEAVKLRPRNKKYIALRDQWKGLLQAIPAAV